MGLGEIIVAIVILGLIVWVVNAFLPIDARFKNLIVIIAVAFVAIWFLQGMGWLGSLRGGANSVSIK